MRFPLLRFALTVHAAVHAWQPVSRPPACTCARRAQALLSRSRSPALLSEAAEVDLRGLQKEAERVLARAYKKLEKATARAEACEAEQEELLTLPEPPLAALEKLPNCAALRVDADAEAKRTGPLSL